jgi:hypothetical protein
MSSPFTVQFPLLFSSRGSTSKKKQEDDMKKAAGPVIFILCLLLVSGSAYGASNKCRVIEADEKKLVLECERDTYQFKVGDQVKIKSMRKSAAVEGC